MKVQIILGGRCELDSDGPLEPEVYRTWETDETPWVLSDNEFIIQVAIGKRQFVVLATHWGEFEAGGRKELWATELYPHPW